MPEAHVGSKVFAISHEINPSAISFHEIEFDSLLKWVKYGLLGKAASACCARAKFRAIYLEELPAISTYY
jgi:hypothetical protein